jgi:hypothetical protein
MGFFYSANSFSNRPKLAKMADKSATWQPWRNEPNEGTKTSLEITSELVITKTSQPRRQKPRQS